MFMIYHGTMVHGDSKVGERKEERMSRLITIRPNDMRMLTFVSHSMLIGPYSFTSYRYQYVSTVKSNT